VYRSRATSDDGYVLILRSLAYNAAFYLNTLVQMIFWTPYYFLAPRHRAWFIPKFWSQSNLWLLKVIAGTESRIEGLENLPDGPFILAPKHQSLWDTIAFFPYLKDPVYILKRELMWIPLFGWYVGKMRMIPIDRGSRSAALRKAMQIGRQRMGRAVRQAPSRPTNGGSWSSTAPSMCPSSPLRTRQGSSGPGAGCCVTRAPSMPGSSPPSNRDFPSRPSSTGS
jgi:hypothetical protein